MDSPVIWTPLIIIAVGVVAITFVDLAFWWQDRRDRRGR